MHAGGRRSLDLAVRDLSDWQERLSIARHRRGLNLAVRDLSDGENCAGDCLDANGSENGEGDGVAHVDGGDEEMPS